MSLRRSESPQHSDPPLHQEEPQCVDSLGDSTNAAIDFVSRDGRIHGFPYSQLVNYLFDANPEIQGGREAPPERLTLQFSSHDVILTGWRLNELRPLLRSAKIATISALDPRYVTLAPRKLFIAEIVVTPIKGTP